MALSGLALKGLVVANLRAIGCVAGTVAARVQTADLALAQRRLDAAIGLAAAL
jgi:hypothetical protein